MLPLVLRRLAATVPVLLLVTAGVFALLHLTPGDPVDAMMAESADATAKASLRAELGLDRPLAVQYLTWMGRLLRGDLGHSIRNGEPVVENVGRRIRPSLQLAGLAMAVSLLIAVPVFAPDLEFFGEAVLPLMLPPRARSRRPRPVSRRSRPA